VEHRWEYLSANKSGSILHALERIDLEVHGGFPWKLHSVGCVLALPVFYVTSQFYLLKKSGGSLK
jgi:hypothetical protein